MTRAIMVRADGILTPCSAWQIKGGNAAFTCDDSDFPAKAFPYVIDPGGTFYPTASGDDGWAENAGYAFGSCPAWPGGLTPDYAGGLATLIVRSRSSYSNPICYKYSDQRYVRFDTSSIPSAQPSLQPA